jgi:hypothetical protein
LRWKKKKQRSAVHQSSIGTVGVECEMKSFEKSTNTGGVSCFMHQNLPPENLLLAEKKPLLKSNGSANNTTSQLSEVMRGDNVVDGPSPEFVGPRVTDFPVQHEVWPHNSRSYNE